MTGVDWALAFVDAAPLIPVVLIVSAIGAGWTFGGRRLRALHRRIRSREVAMCRPVTTAPWVDASRPVADARLAVGTVVVSMDAFRGVLSALQKLTGGEVAPYSTLLDLARREALLRMYEKHPRADAFVACRIMTSSLEESASYVEVLATSTAVRYEIRS